MTSQKFTTIWLLALLTTGVLYAQETPAAKKTATDTSLQQFFDDYMGAMKAGDWQATAKLMHPDALLKFRGLVGALAATDPSGEMGSELLGLQEGESVESIPPDAVFARFMNALVMLVPNLKEILQSTSGDFLGTVAEGDEMHVVFRAHVSAAGLPMSKVDVTTVRRHGGEWRAVLDADVEAMVQGMLREMEAAAGG